MPGQPDLGALRVRRGGPVLGGRSPSHLYQQDALSLSFSMDLSPVRGLRGAMWDSPAFGIGVRRC